SRARRRRAPSRASVHSSMVVTGVLVGRGPGGAGRRLVAREEGAARERGRERREHESKEDSTHRRRTLPIFSVGRTSAADGAEANPWRVASGAMKVSAREGKNALSSPARLC